MLNVKAPFRLGCLNLVERVELTDEIGRNLPPCSRRIALDALDSATGFAGSPPSIFFSLSLSFCLDLDR